MRGPGGWLATWLRVLWRHWPVLLSLAVGAMLIRGWLTELVVVPASRWREGLGGQLTFALLPLVMLVAMILMFRVVRPSLPFVGPREPTEPVLRHLASVVIPFIGFYLTAGYLDRDSDHYTDRSVLAAWDDVLSGSTPPRFLHPSQAPLVFLGIVAAALLLRWVFSLLGSARRTVPGLLAIYPEILWVAVIAFATNEYLTLARYWFERTRIYHWFTSRAGGWDLPWLTTLFPNVETTLAVIVVPVTSAVIGTTVLVTATRPRPDEPTGLRRLFPTRRGGGRLAVLRDALGQVVRGGVGASMLFCLAFAVVGAVPGYLFELERLLIGPRDYGTVWFGLVAPLELFNEAIALVLMVSLVAAFVDRTARRQAAQVGAPPSEPADPSHPAAGEAGRSGPGPAGVGSAVGVAPVVG
jgi:hypothetical protein